MPLRAPCEAWHAHKVGLVGRLCDITQAAHELTGPWPVQVLVNTGAPVDWVLMAPCRGADVVRRQLQLARAWGDGSGAPLPQAGTTPPGSSQGYDLPCVALCNLQLPCSRLQALGFVDLANFVPWPVAGEHMFALLQVSLTHAQGCSTMLIGCAEGVGGWAGPWRTAHD